MTAKTFVGASGNSANSSTGNQYAHPGGPVSLSATENFRYCEWLEAGDASDLEVFVGSNASTASAAFALRINAADTALVGSITALTTGWFADLVNTVTLADGNNVNSRLSAHTTSAYAVRLVAFHFTADATGVTVTRQAGASGSSYSTASTTRRTHAHTINSWQTNDNDGSMRCRHSMAAEYLFTYISANARTNADTVGLRLNGAAATLSASITASTTGAFSDLVNSDAMVDGDYYTYFHTTDTSTASITLQMLGSALRSTAGAYLLSAWMTVTTYTTDSSTTYRALCGHTGNSLGLTNSAGQSRFRHDGTLSNYTTRVRTNTRTTTCTMQVCDDAGTGLNSTISIAAATTGILADDVSTDDITSGDSWASSLVTSTGGGGLATSTQTVLITPASGAVTVTGSQATESTTANAGSPVVRPQGSQATETNTANAGTAVTGVTGPGSQATETSTANAGAPLLYVGGAKATETDTANAGAPSLTVAGSQASETSTGNAGAPRAYVGGAQATETSTATAGTAAIAVIGSQASETGTATAGAPAVTIAGSRAEEETTAYAGTAVTALWGLLDLIVGRLHECWAMELRNPQLLIGDLHPPAWTVGEAHSAWSFGHLRL